MASKKTVLQINTTYRSSPGRIMEMLQQYGSENGYRMVGSYGRGNYSKKFETIKIGTKWDVYGHVLLTRLFDKHGFGSKKATRNFIKEIEEINPNIIHLHNIHGYYINVEILFDYINKINKPIIWTLHDCWSFTGHCTYFDYIGCSKWKNGCEKCPNRREYPRSLLLDFSKKNYLRKKKIIRGIKDITIVTPSKWLAELVKQSYLNDYPVKVINNGIDLEIFKPKPGRFKKKYRISEKFVILGVASIWGKRKALYYFLELSRQLKNSDVIVLVGLTREKIKLLPNNIIGISRTENICELSEIYSDADVFINPTLEDNFPTTNLESLACGTPVITFNTGGSPECIDDSCGIIVEKGNVDGIVDAVEKIKKQDKEQIKENCINRARKYFDKNNKFIDYLELYNEILKNH